jgi:hypothetical protein
MLSQAAITIALLLSSPVQPYVHFPSVISIKSFPIFSRVCLFSDVGFLSEITDQKFSHHGLQILRKYVHTAHFSHRAGERLLGIRDSLGVIALGVANSDDLEFGHDVLDQFFVGDNSFE